MEVILSHSNNQWIISPISDDYIVNSLNSNFEAKLYISQNQLKVIKFECKMGCKTCG